MTEILSSWPITFETEKDNRNCQLILASSVADDNLAEKHCFLRVMLTKHLMLFANIFVASL